MKKRIVALLLILVLLAVTGAAAAATYYRVNTSWLKLRQLPDAKSTVLDSYRTDFAATIVKKVDSTWSLIKFTNGHQGYAMTSYLSPTKSHYSAWITENNTYVRTGPSTTFPAAGTFAKGTKVTVLSHGTAFDYVSSGDTKGYVRNSYLSTSKVAKDGSSSGTAVNYTAWVANGNRTVNFRSAPAQDLSNVIAEYPTGTAVTVLEHGPTWDYVSINGTTGYMMTKFLSRNEPILPDAPAPEPAPAGSYTAWVTCPNHGSVNVHSGAGMGYSNAYRVRYGWQVTVLNQVDSSWYKISYNGKTGYILGTYLTGAKPADAPETNPDPAPATTTATQTYPYTATVTCTEGEKVNVRMGAGLGHSHVARLDPGTQVNVLKDINSDWVKIEVNGTKGYVMKKFLK